MYLHCVYINEGIIIIMHFGMNVTQEITVLVREPNMLTSA